MTRGAVAALKVFRDLGAILPERSDYLIRSLRVRQDNGAWSWALETPDGRCWGGSQWALNDQPRKDRRSGVRLPSTPGILTAHRELRVVLSRGSSLYDYDLSPHHAAYGTVCYRTSGMQGTNCGDRVPRSQVSTDLPEAVTCPHCKVHLDLEQVRAARTLRFA